MACLSLSSPRILWTATVALVFLTKSSAAQAFDGTDKAMMYLAQYGYLNPSVGNRSSGQIMDESSWRQAVAEFQSFAGLNVTGELDEETTKVMSLPRCGVRDKVGFGDSKAKRYALQGSRWRIKNLTYKISKYPSKLNRIEVDTEIVKAFSMLANYTDLSFSQKRSGQVHIDIRFETGEHGDGDPFDGPGGTLAHAYFPVYGSDAHFDDEEMWSINSRRGTNLFQVAAHEFGHSLGLSHSNVRSALMAPFSKSYDPDFQLDQDDIQGIQALYGRKTQPDVGSMPTPSVTTTTTTTPQPATEESAAEDPALCADPNFDTIFNSADGRTIIFKGEHYWRLTEGSYSVARGYPQLISRTWLGLPSNIDAAFTYKNGMTYFFKGSKYWRYNGYKMDWDFPREISKGFIGIPDNINTALVWSGDGKIYFFKGSKFWRYEPDQYLLYKSTYPKPLSNWKGIPDNINAALHFTNGITYFFKGASYWRFDDTTFRVYKDPKYVAYPYSTAFWWLGCGSAPRGTMPPEQSGSDSGENSGYNGANAAQSQLPPLTALATLAWLALRPRA